MRDIKYLVIVEDHEILFDGVQAVLRLFHHIGHHHHEVAQVDLIPVDQVLQVYLTVHLVLGVVLSHQSEQALQFLLIHVPVALHVIE